LKPGLDDTQRKALGQLADLVYESGVKWGEAGFILGLAVGQRMSLSAGGVR
jgi:hypothetical protein